MKIAIIHGSNQGFFPRFYEALKDSIENSGNQVGLFVPNSGQNNRRVLSNQINFGFRYNWHIHNYLWNLTGKQDCWSHISTYDLIRKLKRFHPNIIHLHVINQMQINMPMFVEYVNKYHIPIVWTFHDCRAFTGNCPYFDEIGCEQWRNGCVCCPKETPYKIKDPKCVKWQWNFRKKWFKSINNLTIITPSQWLAEFVKQSFFCDTSCKIIYNGVDTYRFSNKSSFDVRSIYGIGKETKIVLGCAINWEFRKGLKFFEEMTSKLSDNFVVVLVGGIKEHDKSRLESIGIKLIGRTKTIQEMVAWYQEASVFVNPTLADNFPTTNIEALASGTPVVTFNTGGSAESIDETCGIAVEKGNDEALLDAILEVCNNPEKYSRENCIKRSQCFSLKQFDKYVELYHRIVNE